MRTRPPDLHRNPELSLKEERTAAKMAQGLRELGFEVTEKVGGFGVVGVLRNGKGPTDQIAVVPGYVFANVNTVELVVRGRGGHGAQPQKTVDPVVIAARVVTTLQTLVSRETSPTDPAVVTVGSIHGGTKSNIIPDEVELALTVRSYDPAVQKALLEGIERIAKAEAMAARAPGRCRRNR